VYALGNDRGICTERTRVDLRPRRRVRTRSDWGI